MVSDIKKQSKKLGWLLIGYTFVFQLLTFVGVGFMIIFAKLVKLPFIENASLYLMSDLAQVIASIFFVVLYVKNRKAILQ